VIDFTRRDIANRPLAADRSGRLASTIALTRGGDALVTAEAPALPAYDIVFVGLLCRSRAQLLSPPQ
jgi:hypothetical protein